MSKMVVFVPGVKASELWEGRKIRRWPSFRASDIERLSLQLGATSLEAKDMLDVRAVGGLHTVQVYGPLLDSIRKSGYSLRTFPYDWRYSILDQVTDLGRLIRGAAEEAGSAVTIICHSMGGLLAKAFLLKEPNPDQYVEQVITIGTPWHGAPQAYRTLMYGELWPDEKQWKNYAAAIFEYSLPATPQLLAEIARHCPSAYQLLPHPSYFNRCSLGGYLVLGSDGKACTAFDSQVAIDNHPLFPPNSYAKYAVPLQVLLAQPWPEAIPNFCLVGHGIHTVGQIVEEPRYYLERYTLNRTTSKAAARFIDGDKTVPVISALPPADHKAVVRFVREKHEKLTTNPGAIRWVHSILSGTPGDDIEGIETHIVHNNEVSRIVMVSCPVDIAIGFGNEESPMEESASPSGYLPEGVDFYYLGETRYFALSSDTALSLDIDSYGAGPLNVGITEFVDQKPVRVEQFREIELTPRTSARIEVIPGQETTIAEEDGSVSGHRLHRPVVTDDPKQLRDQVPPEVRIVIEPLGGGKDVGKVAQGFFQLRLETQDESGVLESFFRINHGNWERYDGEPVRLDHWGLLSIDAYATDKLRNRSPKLIRRHVRLTDPNKQLRPHIEYSSGSIQVYLKTYEGTDPETELAVTYQINGGALQKYTGAPIEVEYNVGIVKVGYKVQNFAYPNLETAEISILTDNIQRSIWGTEGPISPIVIATTIAGRKDANPQRIELNDRVVGPDTNLHAAKKAEVLRLFYPDATYAVHLRPTYECYIQADEIVTKGGLVQVEFEMHDEGRQVTYPAIVVRILVKYGKKHKHLGAVMPRVRPDGKYEFEIDTRDLPRDSREFRLEFSDSRRALRTRALLIK